MKKFALLTIAASAALLSSYSSIAQGTWDLDKAHAKLGFTITHLMVSDVEGFFKNFDAKIVSTKADFTDAKVDMSAEMASVNTDNEKRDEHLKSPDFFDATKYPKMTFVSKSFKKDKGNAYKVTGDLTMHGVTKPVTLTAVARMGTNPMSKKTIAGFKITGKIKRTDFGIGASMPTAMLSDEIIITANSEFAKN